jgi:hypothetical protein
MNSGIKALIDNAKEMWKRRGLMSFDEFYDGVKVLGVERKQAQKKYLIAIDQYKSFIISEFKD